MICEHCGEHYEALPGRGSNVRVSCYTCTLRPNHRSEGYKNKHLKKRYGITLHDLNERLKAQNYKCRICSRDLDNERYKTVKGKGRSPAEPVVDHCHASGLVRGILCFHCNTALGHVFDNPTILDSMKEYISGN